MASATSEAKQASTGTAGSTSPTKAGDGDTNHTYCFVTRQSPTSLPSNTGGKSLIDTSFLQISMQSLIQEMSIEDAVEKVKELMLENQELREILHQNNDVLRNQHQTLVNMREKQEQEKNIIQQKFSEAKDVVLALREEVQNKSRLLDELQRNIKDQFEIITKKEVGELEEGEQGGRGNLDSEEQLWQSQYEQLKSADYHARPEEQADLVIRRLQENLAIATSLLERQKKSKEDLQMEKRELIAMNNALTSQMAVWRSNASTPDDTLKSDVLFDREQEMARRRRAAETGEEYESVSLTSAPPSKQELWQQKEQQMIQQLLLQLQEERDANSALHSKTSEAKSKIDELEQEVGKLRHKLNEKDQELSSKITQLTKEHQHKIEEVLQKNATDKHSTSLVEKQSLQQQVISMASEMKQAYKQVEDLKNMLQVDHKRVKEVQEKLEMEKTEHEQYRTKVTDQMKTLNLANLTLQETRKLLQKDIEQLVQDYQQLKRKYDDLQRAAMNQKSTADQYHNAVVRLAAAQEALTLKNDEIATLHNTLAHKDDELCSLSTHLRAMENEIDTIPVLKSQVEIYRSDFEAERAARERQHEEKERLKEELQELHRRNQQLLDDLQSYSSNQFEVMRRQHGSYMTQSMSQEGQHSPHTSSHGAHVTLPSHTASTASTRDRHRRIFQPSAVDTMDNAEYLCPKCHRKCPDFDTLSIHVNDCLDEDSDN